MKKILFVLSLLLSFSSYTQVYTDPMVEHTVILGALSDPVAHQFQVNNTDDYPYYYPDIPGGGYSYFWHTDEGHVSTAKNPKFFFSSVGEHTLHLVLTPRKKGDDDLKFYHSFAFNVADEEESGKSNGDITDVDMYIDGQGRKGDHVYVVVPLNHCRKINTLHKYKVGFNEYDLEYEGILYQDNLSVDPTPETEIDPDLGLNKTIGFQYTWSEETDDVAVVLEFLVKSEEVEELITLTFQTDDINAPCDNDDRVEFRPIMPRQPYDPNYKEADLSEVNVVENPSKKINETEVIYTIHFQNIGNAPVDSITIFDYLPSYLSFASFEGCSEPDAMVTATHVGGLVKWIIAPHADVKGTNEFPTQPEPTTRGWVSFKAEISKEESIIYDTCYCLRNSAIIYFDSLAPITTEANLIVIGDSLCFSPNPSSQAGELYAETYCDGSSYSKMNTNTDDRIKLDDPFVVYPNPFQSDFQLKGEIEDIDQIEVLNAVGQRVFSLPTYTNSIHLDNEPNGIYFLLIKAQNKQQVIRIEKLK